MTRAFEIAFSRREKLTVVYKNDASKANSPCIFSHSFKTKSDIKKTLVVHSKRCFFTKWSFPDLFSEAYFWLEKCEHEARSCTCHSPRTVLAAASIFAMLVLYQLLLKCTKCQYGESFVGVAGLVLSAWAGNKKCLQTRRNYSSNNMHW